MTEDDPACCAAGRAENERSADDRAERTPGERPNRSQSAQSQRDEGGDVTAPDPHESVPATTSDGRTDGMVRLDGGTFTMGTDSDVGFEADGEGPAREVRLDPFFVDRYAVTNAEFVEFARETGYITDSERFGWSFVFEDFVAEADEEHVMDRVESAPWWVAVEEATWIRPEGPSSNALEGRLDHPVTHISWRDAAAYAEWAGKRLPTEAEWEYAARGGLSENRYPWGDELHPDGKHRCNIWQGDFPEHNTGADGYVGTAPVDEYEPNGHGIYNSAGNVWEWCADWFSPDYHTTSAYDPDNPSGPQTGRERVMRGGSYLCHRSWCNRYRVAARSKNTPDSSTGNLGFRCVVDARE
ncbi:formylglycine-generating enzyme family protein [Halovenus marina]|uniref:formylglycine-generating enzyme family protein n=1 Tax=Halovenus marina TaxID=3396621 RepID=UPI003F55A98A